MTRVCRLVHRSGARAASTLAIVAVLAGACGVPLDKSPRDVAPNDRLRTLGQDSTTSGDDAPANSPLIFLVDRDERLVAVRRDVPSDPKTVLDKLIEGPSTEDLAANRATRMPQGVTVVDTSRNGSLLTIDLRVETTEAGGFGADRVVAVAQLVFTATALQCVRSVRFTVNDVPSFFQDEFATLQRRPLTRGDFPSKRPLLSPSDDRRVPTAGC
jgi:hypothetical protein